MVKIKLVYNSNELMVAASQKPEPSVKKHDHQIPPLVGLLKVIIKLMPIYQETCAIAIIRPGKSSQYSILCKIAVLIHCWVSINIYFGAAQLDGLW